MYHPQCAGIRLMSVSTVIGLNVVPCRTGSENILLEQLYFELHDFLKRNLLHWIFTTINDLKRLQLWITPIILFIQM